MKPTTDEVKLKKTLADILDAAVAQKIEGTTPTNQTVEIPREVKLSMAESRFEEIVSEREKRSQESNVVWHKDYNAWNEIKSTSEKHGFECLSANDEKTFVKEWKIYDKANDQIVAYHILPTELYEGASKTKYKFAMATIRHDPSNE